MEKTFQKHGAKPTHDRRQLQSLIEAFPADIRIHTANIGSTPVAGICCFATNRRVESSFYLCADPQFEESQALSLLIFETLKRARIEDYRYFDFGTSSVNMVGRENIFRFRKVSVRFGQFRTTYEWKAER